MKVQLTLAALALSASFGCGSDSSFTAPTTSAAPSTAAVSIVVGARTLSTTAYAPNPVTVAVGGTVTWTNNDTISHTSTADGGAWNSGSMAPGQTFSQTFSNAGTFTYHCGIHPGMVGTITVQ